VYFYVEKHLLPHKFSENVVSLRLQIFSIYYPFIGRFMRGVIPRYIFIWGLLLCKISIVQAQELKPIRTLVLDAGHGGKDPGACVNAVKEKEITLKIILELKRLLNERLPEIHVILTRGGDSFIELGKRGETALDYDADFFISVHCNSVEKTATSPEGAAFYILGTNKSQERYKSYIRENAAAMLEANYKDAYGGFGSDTPEGEIIQSLMKTVFRNESKRLATKMDFFFKAANRKTWGVKQAPFIVLWKSGVPSILVETGYISHKGESVYLSSSQGQSEIAEALFQAIQEYNLEAKGIIGLPKIADDKK
jgi:N-acetylmuramoyl-L-alanine amidase